jgi:hypothetical protein
MSAKKILTPYNFTQNEIQNAVAQVLGAAPGSPVPGQFYYDSTTGALTWRNGTVWINPLARTNHTGTQAWSTLTATPTTLAGYAISDATPSSHVGSGGTAHAAVVAAGASGFMTGTDKTKLDGITTGATANSADATLLSRTNHTGTQLAATISNFDSQVQTSRLDQMAAPTGSLSINSQKLVNVQDGTAAQDAATYGQLQAVLQGRDFKDSVRVATTTSVTQSSLTAIDGVTLVDGDRILDKDNATAANRGIWVAHTGAWTRPTDFDTSAKVTASLSVMVEEGTVYGDKQFTLTTNAPIVLGTTGLTFAQTGAGGTYTQGTGIIISGSVISIDTSVTVRKVTGLIGNGSLTSITLAHSLANQWVTVQVFEVATLAQVECDVVLTDANNVTLNFAVAPTTNQFRVVVIG